MHLLGMRVCQPIHAFISPVSEPARLPAPLQYLEQLDEVMVAERSQLEAMRTQFYRERTALVEATSQAQQVQQLAAMQVAQAQQQASMIQHQAAQQVKAAQQVLMQQQQHQAGSGQAGVLAAGAGGSVPSGATGSQQ